MKMVEIGTLLQNRYLIEKKIGAGGMGAVYLAVDRRFNNYVAIKETFYNDCEFGKAFEREANLLNGLLHPVLPYVSDYFTEGNNYFLVMQFINGEDVSDILKREGAFPVKDVLRWTDELLDVLDYLHSQTPPIIHRDLKPQNLKLTPRGDIFLLDFGLAKLKKEDNSSVRSVFGYSRKYSPLEQIQGTGTDVYSDLFALAATVYHLFTGEPPIDVIARASSIVAGKSDPLLFASEINGEVPIEVARVLNVALALNAENRFVSAKAMRQALRHALRETEWENFEILPESSLVLAKSAGEIINTVGYGNFPALAAFAAATANDSIGILECDILYDKGFPVSDANPYTTLTEPLVKTETGEVKKAVQSRTDKSRSAIFALPALLAIVGLVSAFFILENRKPSGFTEKLSGENSSEINTNSDQSEDIPNPVKQPGMSDISGAESNEKANTRPVAAKKSIENADIEKNSLTEETFSERPTIKTENKRYAAKSKNSNIERRKRVVNFESEPDNESFYRERPLWQRNERWRRWEERRQRWDERNDDEWWEMRRRRRYQRW